MHSKGAEYIETLSGKRKKNDAIQFVGNIDGKSCVTISVTNHGLGPAVLKELHFTRNDKEYKNSNGFCTIYDMVHSRLLEEKADTKLEGNNSYFYVREFSNLADAQRYLAVNKEVLFLKLYYSNLEERKLVEKVFKNVYMDLVYTDIFGSCDWKVTKF